MGTHNKINSLKYASEETLVEEIISNNSWINSPEITEKASEIVQLCRSDRSKTRLDNFFLEYGLTNQEGVALMCLAESLLRIPDDHTCDEIINEKVGGKKWLSHLNNSPSIFVNATTFGLFIAEQVVELDTKISTNPVTWLKSVTSRIGDPVLREAVKRGMDILSDEFVSGTTISQALEKFSASNTPCSFDMLGEAARTQSDVDFFFNCYEDAIRRVGEKNAQLSSSFHEISIKLSAIHPRYEPLKEKRVMTELYEKVFELAQQAAKQEIALTIDAEEQDRLELSLMLVEKLSKEKNISDWSGLGLAVQAYGKRAPEVITFSDSLAKKRNGLMVRLVKGAYWDQEIKIHQNKGAPDLPVFSSKSFTDLNYLHTAKLISQTKNLRPYFATHNAHTIAGIMALYENREDEFEFQRIFGMGDITYKNAKNIYTKFPVTRIYAPVGSKKELLPYLVRRLLENGANSSFVNKYLDKQIPISEVIETPIDVASRNLDEKEYLKHVKSPVDVFPDRKNSKGYDLADQKKILELADETSKYLSHTFEATSIIDGVSAQDTKTVNITSPATQTNIGKVSFAGADELTSIKNLEPCKEWKILDIKKKTEIFNSAVQLIEQNRFKFFYLLGSEAGKTFKDADAEIREAVDFILYYSTKAKELNNPHILEGPTGEKNFLEYSSKGIFLCISPWNFPLAILVGQVAAALLTGNTVVCKPAEDTSLIAAEIIKLLHQAGVPESALHLLVAKKDVSDEATKFQNIDGIAFTGSGAAAKQINLNLATKHNALKTLIAETGGQNVMFVDSSSLKEQVIDDILKSSFYSSGQRCSALRVVYVQEEIFEEYWQYLSEAIQELKLGNPLKPETDLGPIINETSLNKLTSHKEKLIKSGKEFVELKNTIPNKGYFFNPIAFKVNSINDIDGEKFGPILHFIKYKAEELESILEEVNGTGYGLTMGMHSRISGKARQVFENANIGNFYLNRDIVGAVVGVQPFGGQGLSGTGPKAGGPNYLHSFVNEKTFTDNVMATGGNIDLLSKNN